MWRGGLEAIGRNRRRGVHNPISTGEDASHLKRGTSQQTDRARGAPDGINGSRTQLPVQSLKPETERECSLTSPKGVVSPGRAHELATSEQGNFSVTSFGGSGEIQTAHTSSPGPGVIIGAGRVPEKLLSTER